MKFIVALVIVGALLFAFCAGFYMVVLGSVQVSDYHSYDVDPFVSTSNIKEYIQLLTRN